MLIYRIQLNLSPSLCVSLCFFLRLSLCHPLTLLFSLFHPSPTSLFPSVCVRACMRVSE